MIDHRYIIPKFRNKGFGTRMVKHIIKKGYDFMITPTNDAAIKSVIKSGCVTYGRYKDDEGPIDYVFRSS